MKQFFLRRWFLIALATLLLVGFSASATLRPLAEAKWLRDGVVAVVLFLMSLPLGFGAMWQAVKNPAPAILSIALSWGLLPIVAWCVSFLLTNEDMRIGYLVAAATPCTLASAAVWTRRAGGNDAVAIMVTIITNLACFVVMPLWLWVMTGVGVKLPVESMIWNLAILVVLPIVAAQAVRQIPLFGKWASQNKIFLGVGAQCGVLTMITLGIIAAGVKLGGDVRAFFTLDVAAMVVAVLGIHVGMLWLGYWLAWLAGMNRPDRIAVGISGSQKTLMVGLSVAIDYFGGLTMLPIVIYHVGQLLVDTVIADRLKQQVDAAPGSAVRPATETP